METDARRAPDGASSDVEEDLSVGDRGSAATEGPAPTAALVHVPSGGHAGWDTHDDDAEGSQPPRGRTWQQELPRWLATMDSQRTRREYEKAVTYFFATPGVPARLDALTLDLLLAYRGSLALRAERQPVRSHPAQSAPTAWGQRRLGRESARRLRHGQDTGEFEETGERDTAQAAEETARGASPAGPLAPATVNLRLTALRQFLAHCSLWDLVPQLAPERTRAALRRLAVERRRPYQVLAEPEWADFLRAARAPLGRAERLAATTGARAPQETGPAPDGGAMGAHTRDSPDRPVGRRERHGPWGTPRAAKARGPVERSPAVESLVDTESRSACGTGPAAAPAPVRSTAGLTGERTAQRDHALLALALATGLRAIELSLLDLGDLSREWHAGREEWWLVLPDAKTKGQRGGRTLPLAPELVRTLLDYARSTGRDWERAADRATPLFLPLGCVPGGGGGRAGKARAPRRLSLAQMRCIVDRAETQWLAAHGTGAAGDAGPGPRAISPHALRHSTAIALLEGNIRSHRPPASVEHVRGWLGHVDIRTTQGYLAHLDDRRHHRPFVLEPIADDRREAADEDNEN